MKTARKPAGPFAIHRVWIGALTLLIALLMPGVAESVPPRIYKPGDTVRIDGGQLYKILSCTGTGEWDDCQVQPLDYNTGAPVGKPVKMTVRNLRAGEARLAKSTPTAPGGAPAPSASPAPAAPAMPPTGIPNGIAHARPPAPPIAAPGADGQPAGREKVAAPCHFDPPGPAVTAATPFSEALAKRKIYDGYAWKANSTASAPSKIGVTFLSFEIGAPYTNTVENVPGRGATRRHEGAPPGATIHTLKSKHLVCEQDRDGSIRRRVVEGSYTCFIDRHGEWTCPSGTDTKITQLD